MTTKELKRCIEEHYMAHHINLKIERADKIEAYKRLIFKIKLQAGTKVDGVFNRAPDIQAALELPLFAPFWDGQKIYLAVSEKNIEENSLHKMLYSKAFHDAPMELPVALGFNMKAGMVFADLTSMPHALYAGASGSGKSMGLTCLVLSLLKNPVSKVNLILIDVGASSLSCFDQIPHLSYPIVKDVDTAVHVINCLRDELERRVKLSSAELTELPALVCIIDECPSLVNKISNKGQAADLRTAISTLLQRGRQAKIHIVLAAQNPNNDYLDGIDTANITARMAFKCAKAQNSITILGKSGAEKLPGNGAMLYQPPDRENPIRIQGAFVSDGEVEMLTSLAKRFDYDLSNRFEIPEFDPSVVQIQDPQIVDDAPNDRAKDEEFARIIMWVLEHNSISTEKIKQQFHAGNRARDIINRLCEARLISPKNGNQSRQVLVREIDDIPENIMKFLLANGFSLDDIESSLSARGKTTQSDDNLTYDEGEADNAEKL